MALSQYYYVWKNKITEKNKQRFYFVLYVQEGYEVWTERGQTVNENDRWDFFIVC